MVTYEDILTRLTCPHEKSASFVKLPKGIERTIYLDAAVPALMGTLKLVDVNVVVYLAFGLDPTLLIKSKVMFTVLGAVCDAAVFVIKDIT